jgi:hypothetical protein
VLATLQLRQEREVEPGKRVLRIAGDCAFECLLRSTEVAQVEARDTQIIERHRLGVTCVDRSIQPDEPSQGRSPVELGKPTLEVYARITGPARYEQSAPAEEVAPEPTLHAAQREQHKHGNEHDGSRGFPEGVCAGEPQTQDGAEQNVNNLVLGGT